MQMKIFPAIKVCVSVGVLLAVVERVEQNQIIFALTHTNVLFVIISVFLAISAVPVVSYRWYLLAGILSFQISIAEAVRATFAGLFVGQILPGGVGPDIVRGWMVWNTESQNKLVVLSLILDKILSLSAILLIILITMPILSKFLSEKISDLIIYSLVVLLATALVSYFMLRKLYREKKIAALVQLFRKLGIDNMFIPNYGIVCGLALGGCGHTLMIFSAYFLSLALGVESSPLTWILVMPSVMLITAVPISVNGWGVRELTMIYFWGLFGLGETDAFLISICIGLVSIVSSLPGAYFWLTKRKPKKTGSWNSSVETK